MSASDNFSTTDKISGERGKFRVYINGFDVKQQTRDHVLQVDGKGDEVFLSTEVRLVDKDGGLLAESSVRSRTLGDTNGFPDRRRAGTASAKGGLKTGDSFPTKTPWKRNGSLMRDCPPMLVFEGDLVKGGNAVAITAEIWEADGPKDLFNRWLDAISDNGPALIDAIASIVSNPQANTVLDGIKNGLPSLKGLANSIIGVAMNRPIGMVKQGNDFVFQPKMLAFNYETANMAMKTNFGKGPGVLAVNYKDAPELGGDYTVYFQIERAD